MSETLSPCPTPCDGRKSFSSQAHGYEELAADDILFTEVRDGLSTGEVVEDYPDASKGPSVLALQTDAGGHPLHVVWDSQRKIRAGRAHYRLPSRSDKMVVRLQEAEETVTRKSVKLLHEGRYAAEVEVELIDDEAGWAPYLSVGDAEKLDTVRAALRKGDIALAGRYGRVFELQPI